MPQSIAALTGAKIHYHTEVFTPKVNFILGSAATAGISSLAIGILAYYNFFTLPQMGIVALTGGGGALIFADLGTLLYYLVKHEKAKKPKSDFLALEAENDPQWWTDIVKVTLRDKDKAPDSAKLFTEFFSWSRQNCTYTYGIIAREGKIFTIHLFSKQQEHLWEQWGMDLRENGFQSREFQNKV